MAEENTNPIPQNLAPENWVNVVLCIPDDPEWYQALRSVVRLLTRGRFWRRDERENSIKDAQSVGRLIDMTMSSPCNLVDALTGIQAAIETLARNQVDLSLNLSCCGVDSGDGEWGGIPVEPPDPPAEITPPDSGDVPGWAESGTTREQILCALLNALYWKVSKFAQNLADLSLGIIGVGLIAGLILLFFPVVGTYLGGVTLSGMVYALLHYREYVSLMEDLATSLETWFADNWQDIYCSLVGTSDLYDAANIFMSTWVSSAIAQSAQTLGIPSQFYTPIFAWTSRLAVINIWVGDFILNGLTGLLEPNPSPFVCSDCEEEEEEVLSGITVRRITSRGLIVFDTVANTKTDTASGYNHPIYYHRLYGFSGNWANALGFVFSGDVNMDIQYMTPGTTMLNTLIQDNSGNILNDTYTSGALLVEDVRTMRGNITPAEIDDVRTWMFVKIRPVTP